MSTHFNKAYLVVPVIYVGVIFGLLFLQFSGGERFSRTVGPLSLRATRGATDDTGEAAVRTLGVEFNGLSFDFAESEGLNVQTPQAILDLPVQSFSPTEDGFVVAFAGGFGLSFASTEDPVPEVQITLDVPDSPVDVNGVTIDPSRIVEINVPFRFVGNAAPSGTDRASFVTVTTDGRDYFFTAPHDALIDPGNEKLVLKPAAAGRAIRYVEAVAGNPATVLGWFANGSRDISDAAYEQAITEFTDAAFAGWTSGRYNASRLTWDGPSGSAEFSESTLAAYLAEAWRRNDYDRAFAEMRRAKDLHPEDLGLLSSAYLGDLSRIAARTADADAATSRSIRADIDENRASVFRMPGIFVFAADRGEKGLYTDLLDFAASLDLRSMDVTTAVGMVGNAVLSPLPDDRARDVAQRFNGLVERVLLGAVMQINGGFYLQSAPGQIDLALSATAGKAIAALGADTGQDALIAIGRNLVVSALGTADRFGMMPATLLIRGGSADPGPGLIAPEELYPVLADNPNYPHEVSLAELAGQGVWAWTAVDFEPSRISETEWRITLRYPRLRTYFLLMSGVPSVSRMELFGQTWRDAPDFEIYSKGRHYAPDTETLMIKYYDDSVQRDVVIYL